MENKFVSIFAKEFESFVYEYHVQGFKSRGVFETLRMLDRYLESIDLDKKFISNDVYKGWIQSMKGVCNSTLYARFCIGRRFIKYICELGFESPIPILPKRYQGDFTPYIYSEDEMRRIFDACDNYRDKNPLRNTAIIMFPAIIRLLYSTGMRIGEALLIKNQDIDFERHVITLRDTKNNRERLCPINESLEAVLRQYLMYRNKLGYTDLNNPDRYFFVGLSGKKSKTSRIWSRFHDVLVSLDIKDTINGGYPRLHDLRHTACVHAMKKLIEEGQDIYCCLGVLSAFLGHVKVVDTERYVRLTHEVYPELIKKDAVVSAAIHSVISRNLIIKDDETY